MWIDFKVCVEFSSVLFGLLQVVRTQTRQIEDNCKFITLANDT